MKGIQRFLSQDRAGIIGVLFLICVLAWVWLAPMHMAPSAIPAEAVMALRPWTVGHAWSVFLMWAVMMIAMMIPGATPMILACTQVEGRPRAGVEAGPALLFLLGYLSVWAAFSAFATLAQWTLEQSGLLSMTMASSSAAAAGLLLTAAGAFQFTQLKRNCLAHCRRPMGSTAGATGDGPSQSLGMGLHHGVFCVGGCWALMTLLFVFGVMNLYAVALLTAFVLLEKVLPRSGWLTQTAGIVFIVWGLWLLLR